MNYYIKVNKFFKGDSHSQASVVAGLSIFSGRDLEKLKLHSSFQVTESLNPGTWNSTGNRQLPLIVYTSF